MSAVKSDQVYVSSLILIIIPPHLLYPPFVSHEDLFSFKRLCDLVLACLLLILFSPIILITLGIKYFEDFGSPIYISQRVGLDKEIFNLFKIRSMSVGKHEAKHPTASNRSPITPVGKFLRVSKLDELLQLINIINGSMSFVGRRPDIPVIVNSDIYDESTDYIFTMKPGLTDLACIYFSDLTRIASRFDDPHSYYVSNVWPIKKTLIHYHIYNQSFFLELLILVGTPISVFLPAMGRKYVKMVIQLGYFHTIYPLFDQ